MGTREKTLLIGILLSLSTGVGLANTTELPESLVLGYRNGANTNYVGEYYESHVNAGIMGNQNNINIPFNSITLSNKTVETFGDNPSQTSTDVLVNVPAIRSSSSTLFNDLSLRGQNVSAYQFRLNGIPNMFCQTNLPMNFVDKVNVISGPGMGIEGVAGSESAGGIINFVTKVAPAKNQSKVGMTFAGKGQFGQHFDISNRFGKNKEAGVRIVGEYVSGETAIPNETVMHGDIAVNLDYVANRSKTNLFILDRDSQTERAQRYFNFDNSNITKVPDAPSSKNNYAFDGQQTKMRTYTIVLNHEQKINDDTVAFVNSGYSYNNGYDYIVPQASRLNVINDNGDFNNTIWNEPYAIKNGYLQLGFRYKFDIKNVKNELALAWDKDWYTAAWGSSDTPAGTVTGNLFTGLVERDFITKNKSAASSKGRTQYSGWTLVNTSGVGKLGISYGAHYHKSSATSANGVNAKSSATSPVFGIVYKPNKNLSFYANHTESFQSGYLVKAGYANAGEILPPSKTKSNEIGVKFSKNKTIASVSVYDMSKAATFTKQIQTNPKRTIFTTDGREKYKGIELTLAQQFNDKWTISGGVTYIASKYAQTNNEFLIQKQVSGVPKWSGVAIIEYSPKSDTNIWTRLLYSGNASIYTKAERELTIPSYLTLDIGIRKTIILHDTPVDFSLTVYNVTNKNYWLSRPSYNYGILGNPRTIAFSTSVKF